MKITVSISKHLFETAERFRQQTQKSPSRLWRDALTEYLARHTREQVTAAMNKALQELATSDSGFVSASARRILERSEW
jgi:metal-responsive CopG/Arc/MetJ family transcriptional regulator